MISMNETRLFNVTIYIITLFILCPLLRGESPRLTEEQRIVAMTILGEARGEGEAGMYAVACVIAQRSIAWEKTPTQVCLKNNGKVWQFSCWNKNDPNRKKLPSLLNTPQGAYAKRLDVNLNNLQRSFVKYADHYCHINKNPFWSYKTITRKGKKIKIPIKPLVVINRHKFYKLR